MKDNCCTLMPPHQLYRATHSCHLDRFLLPPPPQVLYHPCRKPPAAQQIGTIKAGIAFSRAPQLLHRRSSLHERGGRRSRPPLEHVGLRVRSISGEPARLLYPPSRPTSFIRTVAAAAAARRKRSRRGGRQNTRSCPLDCIEIKATVWRCPQENDITRNRAAYSNTRNFFLSFLILKNFSTVRDLQYIIFCTCKCSLDGHLIKE